MWSVAPCVLRLRQSKQRLADIHHNLTEVSEARRELQAEHVTLTGKVCSAAPSSVTTHDRAACCGVVTYVCLSERSSYETHTLLFR